MEKLLYAWYSDVYFNQKQKVTSKDVKLKAKEFSTDDNFKASKGWLEKFKLKYNLVLVRAKRTNKVK